ncbi:MAG: NAD(P)-binding domain-containing protein, partial [Hymenobacteraceae bacterium]|nr:NAD(P)-binding domain-containing protein [Hymenobacteraceae bacterium]MDX5397724.1 NAD(P)-binding domain-containing protein [Hymenobacteraceae bacterium]MDX5513802.1 NAD(P)-binding domain-containing protein [Hymenobacteraceae bacterium]
MSFIIMGVSGSGKSTVGKLLANALSLRFIDADDYHSRGSILKMTQGISLNDDDRRDWLLQLNQMLKQAEAKGEEVVMACSALKETYRQMLQQGVEQEVRWVFLHGSEEVLQNRIGSRTGHFMPKSLLETQLQTLEEPTYGLHLDIAQQPNQIINQITRHFMSTTQKAAFGIIGMGVMGKSLTLNLAGKGITTAVFNRHLPKLEEKVAQRFADEHPEQPLLPFDNMQAFVKTLEKPRRVLLMVKAGAAVDTLLEQLLPLLEEGDLVMDGGNSHYLDTSRRTIQMHNKLIHYLGVGISGGEEGALKGPSLMPGGTLEGYRNVEKFLLAMAAKDKNGDPCCAYIGPEGAGHFVKMVHNGIEYAEMQLLAEIYQLMRFNLQLTPQEITAELKKWQNSGQNSYLLEITIAILQKKEGEELLLDKILDAAEQKGTGGWSTNAAL